MHDSLKKHIRPHYQSMSGYVSAGMETGKNEDLVFMNANESHHVLDDLKGYNFYPEPQPQKLLELMGQAYGVSADNIMASRGADEALVLLTKVFCEPHQDAILIHKPTFGMYAVNADSSPVIIHDVPLIKTADNFELDKERIIQTACNSDNKIKIIYLCNPNNPTGGSFAQEDILEIIEAVNGHAVVVLDEAYAEYSRAGGMVSALEDHPNLIILRTLSKAYALAGVRMGAMLCYDTEFVDFMRDKALDAYPLPRPAIEAALVALAPENQSQIQQNIQTVLEERDRLKELFKRCDFVKTIYKSDSNFLMIEVDDATALWQHCKNNGFVIRDFSSKAETPNCLRISPASAQDNNRFMEVFSAFKG